ncbi:MAG: alpha/beta hydrolase-fold protein [Saprospiraceae bacterium]
MRKAIFSVLSLYATILLSQNPSGNGPYVNKPFILGIIDEIDSKILSEQRILNIYLPEGYYANDTLTYPVVYLLDGGADEDFIHIVGLYQFNAFPWINRVPKSIVVGIANIDRQKDFTYPTSIENDRKKYPTTGHSDKYIQFIESELQPFIQDKYKANDSKTIIGESLGGLLATEIVFKKPKLFNTYIIISPSLWWDNASLLNMQSAILQKDFPGKTSVYIGVGKEGLVTGDFPHVMEVDANMLADKLKTSENENLNVYFDYLPQENHATVSHQAVFNALRLLYPLNEKEK